jgi:carboxypeptidase family protein
MRNLVLAIVLAGSAVAQSVSVPTIVVTDENGNAVASARVTVESSPQPAVHCETDYLGRCRFPSLAAGSYQLRVEKEGFYANVQPSVQITPASTIEVTISHQQEVREVVDVVESPPAIDPAQVSAQESISGLDVLNIVYPATHDYRNALNFIPGVVQDQGGQPHVAGAQTYQTVTLLDGFNVTQPANGLLLVRVSTDAFRSIQVEPARKPAEYGKGSGGVLILNTGIGDDHYRFYATDFIPSVQDKHGWRFDQFLPRFTLSGPVRKGKMWFYDGFDGEYDNDIFTELPAGQDNDHVLRLGNLTKIQTNLTSRNILTTSFLVNHLHDQYAFLSPNNPQQANPKDVEGAYVASAKDQHYFKGGELLETGFAFDEYDEQLTPYGTLPYFVNVGSAGTPAKPATAGGNFYLADETHARRWQAITNLFLPSHQWHGQHDFKVGTDIDRIDYDAQFFRAPISYMTDSNTLPPNAPDLCLTAPPGPNFPCTRYSTFGAGPLHREFNTEVSAYAEDRWSVNNRLLIEPGVRMDWDEIVRHANIAPRLAGAYVLDNSGNTKLSAGIGLVYDATPIFLIARPFAGQRTDCFFDTNGLLTSTVLTTFAMDRRTFKAPRFLNWSVGLEKKLPAAIYMKAEFLEKRGSRGFVYNTLSGTTGGDFVLENTRDDRYDALQITLRRSFRESYMVMGSYTRSRARSNQALDFNVDNPVLSGQQPGPYPWDTPNRFLSWGYVPFFKLPVIHLLELAYSMEARTGFPFTELTDQQQLYSKAGAERFPEYFALNLQLEKRFHFLGYYLALRGGFDNITGRCNPFVVSNVIDGNHPAPTFSACEGRAFTSRIRLLGRK